MKKLILTLLFLCLAGTIVHAETVTDNGRIYRVDALKVVHPTTEEEFLQIFGEAQSQHIPLVSAGKHHSQGGQSLLKNGIVVDMNAYNHIVSLDVARKRIVVQAGVNWEQIQEAINPQGLSVKVMQSSNIFTIGGSLSVNAHGRDPRYSTLIETVLAIKVLLPDGSIRWLSRDHEDELFKMVIGGYGLFGIILEAELELTDNVQLTKYSQTMPMEAYPEYFANQIANNPEVELHYGRFYIGEDDLLNTVSAVTYQKAQPVKISKDPLQPETNIAANKAFLQLLRAQPWAKKAAWKMEFLDSFRQTSISRNNAMRPPVLCLDYRSPIDTDILQEYFIPAKNFVAFTHQLREIIQRHGVNLLNITLRFLKADKESFLTYSPEDCFAFVLYINHGLSESGIQKATQWTQEMVDAALAAEGTYYLPYQRYPTREQRDRAYPNFNLFVQKKKELDPQSIFLNEFYLNL